MVNKLVLASILALAPVSTAVARTPLPPVGMQSQIVFSIDQKKKADVELPEFRFELRSDGTWTYVETSKQTTAKQARGKLSRGQVTTIRQLLRTSWTVARAEVTCMAFAAVYQEYSVFGKAVWTDEMCSGMSLDRASSKRLAQVMAIVSPLMASAK